MQGEGLTIREMGETAAVSRASYYRNWRNREPKQEELFPQFLWSADHNKWYGQRDVMSTMLDSPH